MLITPIAIQTPLCTSPKLAMIIAMLTPIAKRKEFCTIGLCKVISFIAFFRLFFSLNSSAILSSPPSFISSNLEYKTSKDALKIS